MRIHQLIVGTTLFLAAVNAVLAGELKAKTAVLVHGAFADGSSWHKVIPILERAGLKVVAVQNPLDSLENDVAATKRAIRDADRPARPRRRGSAGTRDADRRGAPGWRVEPAAGASPPMG